MGQAQIDLRAAMAIEGERERVVSRGLGELVRRVERHECERPVPRGSTDLEERPR